MALPRSRFLRCLLVVVFVAGLFFLTRQLWLTALGRWLVESQTPARADVAVVLAGDQNGWRILKAAELVQKGYVPKVLVSGPDCCYEIQESELAIALAVKKGYPRDWFIALPLSAHSTSEESHIIVKELDRLKIHKFLLVTSDYHTRRAARVYRRLVPSDRFRVIAAPDRDFRADDWWRRREGRKQCAIEWLKTVADWLGM